MSHTRSPAQPLAPEMLSSRRDTFLAAAFTAVGIIAIIAARGGIEHMIAGSVGSIGAGCIAVGLVLLDPRLSYAERTLASLPIICMLAGVGLAIKDNALAFAGYPLLLLGVGGLVPASVRARKTNAVKLPAKEESVRTNSMVSAMSN